MADKNERTTAADEYLAFPKWLREKLEKKGWKIRVPTIRDEYNGRY